MNAADSFGSVSIDSRAALDGFGRPERSSQHLNFLAPWTTLDGLDDLILFQFIEASVRGRRYAR